MANVILNIDPSYINLYTDSSEKLSPVILLYESSSLTGSGSYGKFVVKRLVYLAVESV